MARPRTVDLADVVLAARSAFAQKGLRRTLMSDIARRAGVSTGTLYNVAVSKDALFLAMFLPADALGRQSLPLTVPPPEEMLTRVEERLRAATRLQAQELALARDRADDPRTEVRELVGERYDVLAANWQLLAAVEQTARDVPEVFDAYYAGGRDAFIGGLARYLASRSAAGQVRAQNPVHTARFVVEVVAYWAWHRREDLAPVEVTEAEARALVQDLVVAALVP